MAQSVGRSAPHWTKLPENAARVKAMVRKRELTRQRNAHAKEKKERAPQSRKKPVSRGHAQLVAYARLGAEVTIQRCTEQINTAKVFLAKV